MPEPTSQWLSELLAEILQEAAFVSAEPASGPPWWGVPVVSATLGFRSTHSGSLRLTTDLPAAIELAANMIGVQRGDPAAAALGGAALGEMLNVVGGALVTRLYGRGVPSALGLPMTNLLSAPPEPHGSTALLRLEGGQPVLLELHVAQH